MPFYSWGSNSYGQLGHGSGLVGCDSHHPKHMTFDPPLSLDTFSSCMLACGANHSVVCLDALHLYACGSNQHGQLGTGDTQDRSVMTRIYLSCFPDTVQYTVLSLACGWDYTLVLVESEARRYLVGFGSNEFATLLLAVPRLSSPTILCQDDRMDRVASGVRHVLTLSRTGSMLWSWGESRHGKLGPRPYLDGMHSGLSMLDRHQVAWQSTAAPGEPDRMDAMCAGHQFSAILTRSRRLLIFGKWHTAARSACLEMKLEDHLPPIHALFSNWGSIFALSSTQGKLFGLGRSRYGQLGYFDPSQTHLSSSFCAIPVPWIASLSTGSEHLLAIVQRTSGPHHPSYDLIAWGWNEHGQLGASPNSFPSLSALTPWTLLENLDTWTHAVASSGYSHNLLYWPFASIESRETER